MSPIFADLQVILAASDCHRSGHNVFIENPCDRWGRRHVYGRLWLLIGKLGLTLADTVWLGIAIAVTFSFAVIMLAAPRNLTETIVSAMMLMSPPVMLAIQRANNDILIFLLLSAAGYLLAANGRSPKIVPLVLIYLSTALKFYPVVSLVVYALWLRDNSRLLFRIIIVSSLLLVLFIWLSYDDLLLLRETIPRPLGDLTWGAQTILNDLRVEAPSMRRLLMLGLVGMTFLAALLITLRINVETPPSHSEIFFVLGFSILLFTFFVTTNFYYRCVFFLLLLPHLFKILRERPIATFTKALMLSIFGLLAISFWGGLVQKICRLLFKENVWLAKSSFLLIQDVCMWAAMTLLLAIGLQIALTHSRRGDLTLSLFDRHVVS